MIDLSSLIEFNWETWTTALNQASSTSPKTPILINESLSKVFHLETIDGATYIVDTDIQICFSNSEPVRARTKFIDKTSTIVEENLRNRIAIAFENNRTFLQITSPSLVQNTAQIKSLTKQVQAILRLVVDRSLLNNNIVD